MLNVQGDWEAHVNSTPGKPARRRPSQKYNYGLCSYGAGLRRSSSCNTIANGKFLVEKEKGKGMSGLRLPSFDKLGISSLTRDESTNTTRRPFPQDDISYQPRSLRSSYRARTSPPLLFGSTPLLTPPDDLQSMKWNATMTQTAEGESSVRSPSTSLEASHLPSLYSVPTTSHAHQQQSNLEFSHGDTIESESSSTSSSSQLPTPARTSNNPDSWLDLAIGSARKHLSLISRASYLSLTYVVQSLIPAEASGDGVRVVSQTLPCPADESTQSSNLYPEIVAQMTSRYDVLRTPSIEIYHAVPPDFSLRSLPQSPPATPNAPAEGDYFSLIFDSATPIQAYHNHHGTLAPQSASGSPLPALVRPRCTVTTSIIERLIPPASPQEYFDLFRPNQSVLADRMVELSPRGGSLIMMYPTKTGALYFRDCLLGPILEPLLRNIVNLLSLYTDLGASLGRMPAVTSMYEFEQMNEKVRKLCNNLSNTTRTSEPQSTFSLVYSSKGQIPLPRRMWSEWFIKQERPRMRELLDQYWARGRRLPRNNEVTSATLLREVIEGLERRPYGEEQWPEVTEVGVFVIRRTTGDV